MQARGEHNPRDFDKYIFRLPIPLYDGANPLHGKLVEASKHATSVSAATELPAKFFQAQRRVVRDALSEDGVAKDLDDLVGRLLGIDGHAVTTVPLA